MQNRILIGVLLLPLVIASVSSAVTPEEAGSAVAARYRITRPGFLGGFNEIGTVLTPLREGLRANRPSRSFAPNVVKDKKVVTPGGGELPVGGPHSGVLKPGERLHLYGIQTGDDYVQLDLFTVATYPVQGMRGPTPLQASLRFLYDKGLASVPLPQLLNDIGEWLAVEGEPYPAQPAPNGAPGTGTGTANPAGAATVHLGQTQDEVIAILGQPEKRVLLGPKIIYVYSRLKVIFIDGELVDAE